jgi:Domain of unknown function (DUF3846)
MRKFSDEVQACRLWRFPAGGEPEAGGDTFPALDEMQRFVGGYIELVQLTIGQPVTLIINEDGRRLGLPINRCATMLYGAARLAEQRAIEARREEYIRIEVDYEMHAAPDIVGNVLAWFGELPDEA